MFIPRNPVVENQFCSYGAQTGTGSAGIGGVVCYAGAVLYLDNDAANQEAVVFRYDTYANKPSAPETTPFGFAMQKVKTGYHQVHPVGFSMPGDLGASDVIAQPTYNSSGVVTGTKAAPLGVAHLGIYDTAHYTCTNVSGTVSSTNYMKPGDLLYVGCNCEARVTNCSSVASGDTYDYEALVSDVIARVVKGASAAKCTANIKNTTLYPIRIKLLI